MNVRDRLKTETATQHAHTESFSYGKEIMSRTLNTSQYQELLIANYLYIKAWEDQWASLSFDVPESMNLQARRKSTWLVNDLKALGLDVSKLPVFTIASVSSYAAFLGRMYVIEGSTMGGAVISKQLALNEHLTGYNFQFYGAYGPELLPMWRSFLAHLDAIATEDDSDETIAAAKESFSRFSEAFAAAKSAVA
ncbi:MAG: heme oxygenase [Bacteroidia bacterium]|jgi:heme oxygenase